MAESQPKCWQVINRFHYSQLHATVVSNIHAKDPSLQFIQMLQSRKNDLFAGFLDLARKEHLV